VTKPDKILLDITTKFGRYQVVDMVYIGRPARVLFSGERAAAQSAIPIDDNPAMLFDYNQRFLELVNSLKPKNLLLIGGGAFTLPIKILEIFPKTEIDVVEQDLELEKIASQFFGLKPNKRLDIIFGDGREYLKSTSQIYDLVLIDAFTHNVIPYTLSTKEFVELLENHLTKNGVVASNIISAYHGPHDSVIKQQYATYKSVFKHTDIFPADKILSYWISQNFLLISTNKLIKPKYNLRFEGLKPPLINSEDIQYDKKS
jgi:predicted O-methyltransferase YrrM